MEAVRRSSDDEVCGYVDQRDGWWRSLVLFGSEIGRHATREDAVAHVLSDGLRSLTERWILQRTAEGRDQVVCIQEANPASVTLALGYHSTPDVPTLTIGASEIAEGVWSLRRA